MAVFLLVAFFLKGSGVSFLVFVCVFCWLIVGLCVCCVRFLVWLLLLFGCSLFAEQHFGVVELVCAHISWCCWTNSVFAFFVSMSSYYCVVFLMCVFIWCVLLF